MDPDKTVRSGDPRVAWALREAGGRARNEAELHTAATRLIADFTEQLDHHFLVRPTGTSEEPRVFTDLKGAGIMYAGLTLFNLGPGTRELADQMGVQFGAMLQGMKGFKSMTMFGDYDTGEYGGFSVWATKEDAEAAMANTEGPMKQAVGDLLKGPPVRKIFQVWEAPES